MPRFQPLDILRGFALAGVLWSCVIDHTVNPSGTLSYWIGQATYLFIDTKFYGLMALLFGAGFVLQADRAAETNRAFIVPYLRRCAFLFLAGICNQVLLVGRGDVFGPYAVMGAMLILVRRWRALPLTIAAAVVFLLIPAQRPFFAWADPPAPRPAGARARPRQPEAPNSFAAEAGARWDRFLRRHANPMRVVNVNLFLNMFALMLLGAAAARRGIWNWSARALKLLTIASVAVGLIVNGYWSIVGQYGQGADTFRIYAQSARPFLAIGYAAGLLWLLSVRQPGRLGVLSWPGRMTLTNYLLLLLGLSLFVFEYGLGLDKKFSALQALPVSAAAFAVFTIASRWWLTRFSHGPIEGIWKFVTYGRGTIA